MHIVRVWWCESHHMAQVSACTRHAILMPSMLSGWAFVLWLVCFFVLDPLCVSLLHLALLFTLLPVLWPELLLPCGQRQGNHTLRLRQPRSLAPWQNSLLPHIMTMCSLAIPLTYTWQWTVGTHSETHNGRLMLGKHTFVEAWVRTCGHEGCSIRYRNATSPKKTCAVEVTRTDWPECTLDWCCTLHYGCRYCTSQLSDDCNVLTTRASLAWHHTICFLDTEQTCQCDFPQTSKTVFLQFEGEEEGSSSGAVATHGMVEGIDAFIRKDNVCESQSVDGRSIEVDF